MKKWKIQDYVFFCWFFSILAKRKIHKLQKLKKHEHIEDTHDKSRGLGRARMMMMMMNMMIK